LTTSQSDEDQEAISICDACGGARSLGNELEFLWLSLFPQLDQYLLDHQQIFDARDYLDRRLYMPPLRGLKPFGSKRPIYAYVRSDTVAYFRGERIRQSSLQPKFYKQRTSAQ